MKIKPTFTAVVAKVFLVVVCTGSGFWDTNVRHAQSLMVGKRKEVSAKQFFTEKYAKKMGRSFVEHAMRAQDIYQWEFKADHTYIATHGAGKDNTTTGEWSVSANQLTMKGAAQLRKGTGAEVYTFSITGNILTRTMMVQPPYNTMIEKQEDTSIRI